MTLRQTIDELESKLTEIDTKEIAHVFGRQISKEQLRIIVEYMRRRREHRMKDVKVIDTVEKIQLDDGGHIITIVKSGDSPVKTLAQHIREQIMIKSSDVPRKKSKGRAIYDRAVAERYLRGFVRVLNPRLLVNREFVHYVTLDGRGNQAFYRGGMVVRKDEDAIHILIHNIIYPVPYEKTHDGRRFESVFFKRQDFSEDEFIPLKSLMTDISQEMSIIKQL